MQRRQWLLGMAAAWPSWAWAGEASACRETALPPHDVAGYGYYTDTRRSEVSPELLQRNREATAPGRRFLADMSAAADRWHGQADEPAALCALQGLQRAAQAEALLGRMLGPRQGQQAEYERKWLLAGLALAYLKLRPMAPPAQRIVIETWLRTLADAVWAFWEDAQGHPTRRTRNNHYTWAALAMAASARATGDAVRWARARRSFEDSLAEVRPDGTLPREWARGARALHYHAFTAGPLVVMNELAQAAGETWQAAGDTRLQCLVDAIADGLADPARFAAAAAAPQERPSPATLAWLLLWHRHDREPARLAPWLQGLPAVPTLGGDLALMAQRGWPPR